MRLNGGPMDPARLAAAAAALRHAWPLSQVAPELGEWFDEHGSGPGAWVVMCSGGADSVALLFWLWAQFPERRPDLRVLHVNHGTRGAESDADATAVVGLAESLGLRVRVCSKPGGRADASEETLRAMREEALDYLCGAESVEGVFTGHQADDVAENILFRLGRGSGLAGLAGLRPVQVMRGRPPRLRPLLGVSRAEIRAVLREHGVQWREDASNSEDRHTRNRLRSKVLPAWEEALGERSIRGGVTRSHRHLVEADAALDAWTELFLAEHGGPALPIQPFGRLPVAVQRRVLRHWWQSTRPVEAPPGDDAIDRLLQWMGEGARDDFAWGSAMVAGDGVALRFQPPSVASDPLALGARQWCLMPDSALSLPGGETVSSSWRALDDELRGAILAGGFSCQREVFLADVEGALIVRGWRPGDRYRPLGAPGRRKLQDAFVDAGIARAQRHRLPVLCAPGGDILWVPGLPPAEYCRVLPETREALWLTYSGS